MYDEARIRAPNSLSGCAAMEMRRLFFERFRAARSRVTPINVFTTFSHSGIGGAAGIPGERRFFL
jgi:hypothetical protein